MYSVKQRGMVGESNVSLRQWPDGGFEIVVDSIVYSLDAQSIPVYLKGRQEVWSAQEILRYMRLTRWLNSERYPLMYYSCFARFYSPAR